MPRTPRDAYCAGASVDFDRLVAQDGAHHRHRCELVERACLFNATVVPAEHGTAQARRAAALAQRWQMRDMWESGQERPLAHYHPLRAPEPGTPAASLVASAVEQHGYSPCVPLVWLPTWLMNFGESLISSLMPIDELQHARLIDQRVLLTPELWRFPGDRFRIWQMVGALVDRHPSTRLRGLMERAAKCADPAARRGRCGLPRCYARLLVCRFRSAFDPYVPPLPCARGGGGGGGGGSSGGPGACVPAPWRAAQRVAAVLAGPGGGGGGGPGGGGAPGGGAGQRRRPPPLLLRVVFVNRTNTKRARGLANLDELLARCAALRGGGLLPVGRVSEHGSSPHTPREQRISCAAHAFGAGSIADDVRAARRADVLVGTHGAGLNNAFFMRRGGALLEVRPYRFEGGWPDKYMRELTSLEKALMYFQVSAAAPELSVPPPARDVSVWHARDHAVLLPWGVLLSALRAVVFANRSVERYQDYVWAHGCTFVSEHPD